MLYILVLNVHILVLNVHIDVPLENGTELLKFLIYLNV